jgi:hypothetical protein
MYYNDYGYSEGIDWKKWKELTFFLPILTYALIAR